MGRGPPPTAPLPGRFAGDSASPIVSPMPRPSISAVSWSRTSSPGACHHRPLMRVTRSTGERQTLATTQLFPPVVSGPTGSLAVNIDSTLPGVTCNVSPSSAAVSSNPATVTVTGHATDSVSGVSLTDGATFSVVDEYGVTQPSGPITLQSNGNYSFTLTLPATKNVGDSTHVYTITVRGTDRAGNTNTASDTLKIN